MEIKSKLLIHRALKSIKRDEAIIETITDDIHAQNLPFLMIINIKARGIKVVLKMQLEVEVEVGVEVEIREDAQGVHEIVDITPHPTGKVPQPEQTPSHLDEERVTGVHDPHHVLGDHDLAP